MGIKISALPVGGALTGTENLPVVQDAETVKVTVQDIADLAVSETLARNGVNVNAGYVELGGIFTQADTILGDNYSNGVTVEFLNSFDETGTWSAWWLYNGKSDEGAYTQLSSYVNTNLGNTSGTNLSFQSLNPSSANKQTCAFQMRVAQSDGSKIWFDTAEFYMNGHDGTKPFSFDTSDTNYTIKIGDVNSAKNLTLYTLTDSTRIHKFHSALGKYQFTNVPNYADNAAALAGGLVSGMIYRTSSGGTSTLKIVE